MSHCDDRSRCAEARIQQQFKQFAFYALTVLAVTELITFVRSVWTVQITVTEPLLWNTAAACQTRLPMKIARHRTTLVQVFIRVVAAVGISVADPHVHDTRVDCATLGPARLTGDCRADVLSGRMVVAVDDSITKQSLIDTQTTLAFHSSLRTRSFSAHGAVFVRVIATVVVAVAKPRVPDAVVASRTFRLTARTPRDRADAVVDVDALVCTCDQPGTELRLSETLATVASNLPRRTRIVTAAVRFVGAVATIILQIAEEGGRNTATASRTLPRSWRTKSVRLLLRCCRENAHGQEKDNAARWHGNGTHTLKFKPYCLRTVVRKRRKVE